MRCAGVQWGYAAALGTPFVLDIAGRGPAEVATEIAVAGLSWVAVEIRLWWTVWTIWSGLKRKCPMYSLPFCGTDSQHCLHSSFIRERAICFRYARDVLVDVGVSLWLPPWLADLLLRF